MGFMQVMEGIGAVTKVLGDLWNVGYGTYQDQRDTNYQRDLQQKIFDREDNAVQRRMADLQAAGLNPNLAAGSSAGAGSVVGRSNAQNVNYDSGSMLDMVSAIQQIGIQKQQQKNLQAEYDYIRSKSHGEALNNTLNTAYMLNQFGVDFNVKPIREKDGGVKWNFGFVPQDYTSWDSPMYNSMWIQLNNQKYQQKILEQNLALAIKENNWYAVKQIFDLANTATQSFGNVMSPFKSYLKPIEPNLKNYSETYTRNKSGYTKSREYY